MITEGINRKLTAILSADAVGYSRLITVDEVGTVQRLKSYKEMIGVRVSENHGRVVDSPGDNLLAEFPSALDATRCAIDIQRVLKDRNADHPADRRMEFRIGIHLGDVMVDGDRIYGDGVNIAARLESLADTGGICISATVYDQVKNKLEIDYIDIGNQDVKNITDPIHVYRVSFPGASDHMTVKARGDISRKRRNLALGVIVIFIIVGLALILSHNFQKTPPSEIVKPEKTDAPTEKPSIAVLPFENMSGDPDQEYFADGMTEEVITRLSKSPQLFVIARNSTFTYKGKPIKVQQVSQELGARYIVEGSIRKAGNSMRITAQMIDAHTGNHIWSETYDREYNINELINIQDEISEQIGGAVLAGYKQSEVQRIKRLPTDNLSAYDAYWRALDFYSRKTEESVKEARKLIDHAINLDPQFAEAYALLCDIFEAYYWYGWVINPQEAKKQAEELAKKAITIDYTSVRAHCRLSRIYLWNGQLDQALSEAGRAISLDPNNADAFDAMGRVLDWSGRSEEAIESLKKAILLDPHNLSYDGLFADAYTHLGRYEEAIRTYNISLSKEPNSPWQYMNLSSCYFQAWSTQKSHDPQYLVRALENAKKGSSLSSSISWTSVAGAWANSILGMAYLHDKQYQPAMEHGKKGMTLSTDDLLIRAGMGLILNYVCRPEETIELFEKTEQLKTSAQIVTAWSLIDLGQANTLTERHEEAIATFLKGFEYHPTFDFALRGHLHLIISYIALGREAEARAEAAEVLKMVPNFSVEIWGQREPYQDQEIIKRFMVAFRKAGLK